MLPTGSHYPRRMQPDDLRGEPPGQLPLPLWADEPPEAAGPLIDLIEHMRLQAQVWADANTLRDTAAARTVRSRLRRQAMAMQRPLPGFEDPQMPLLPDFTGDDWGALEAAVLDLIPRPEQLADIEQAVEVASADPESRKLLARITERLPSRAQVAKLTPWAVFVMVSLDMLKVAPELNPNDIGVLTMILMVVLYLLPPRSGS